MKSANKRSWFSFASVAWFATILLVAGVVIAGICSPKLRERVAAALNGPNAPAKADGHDHAGEAPEADAHDEADHDHEKEAAGEHVAAEAEHEGEGHAEAKITDHKHDDAAAIKLSKQAQGNIGLKMLEVGLGPFERTVTMPGIVVERPGWSVIEVTAPMTGVVTRIYPIQGESVQPEQPLFEVRLTHEDLLQLQTEFLRTVEELDVIGREVARLEKVSADGAIAGKTLLERKYEQQKEEAALRAQRQALLLHGLSKEQVDEIASTRTLLQSLTVRAPAAPREDEKPASDSPSRRLQVQELRVAQGKRVNAGDTLCTLVDHHLLYIEGMAFEQDMQAVNHAAAESRGVAAAFGTKSSPDAEIVPNLRILYLDDKVEQQSRAFHFYISLPNRVARENKTPDGRNFVYWQFKPGQRTQIRVPVEQWNDRIVLPVEAVAQEGAESYVFEANGDHFDRRSVRVEYRDQDHAVIANDGELRVGAMVAASAAHQIQLALKNKSGGGVDPHAGHNH